MYLCSLSAKKHELLIEIIHKTQVLEKVKRWEMKRRLKNAPNCLILVCMQTWQEIWACNILNKDCWALALQTNLALEPNTKPRAAACPKLALKTKQATTNLGLGLVLNPKDKCSPRICFYDQCLPEGFSLFSSTLLWNYSSHRNSMSFQGSHLGASHLQNYLHPHSH